MRRVDLRGEECRYANVEIKNASIHNRLCLSIINQLGVQI